MKKIVIIKPKSLSPKDKEKLTKAGCVVIEHQNPNEVRLIEESDLVTGNAALMSAMNAIANSSYGSQTRNDFSAMFAKRILATEKKQSV